MKKTVVNREHGNVEQQERCSMVLKDSRAVTNVLALIAICAETFLCHRWKLLKPWCLQVKYQKSTANEKHHDILSYFRDTGGVVLLSNWIYKNTLLVQVLVYGNVSKTPAPTHCVFLRHSGQVSIPRYQPEHQRWLQCSKTKEGSHQPKKWSNAWAVFFFTVF